MTRQQRQRLYRERLRAETKEAAGTFNPGDAAGFTPFLEDGKVDVRAQLAKWDAYCNRGLT